MSTTGGGKDMSVAVDMSIPFDLGPADLAIPNDALRPVLFSQFAADYAKVTCTHLAQCGKVGSDAQSQAACLETNARHWGVDYDTEIMRGHIIVNELQCLDALANSRCDGSDQGYIGDRCFQFLFKPMQQTGQPCVESSECANGYCLLPASAGGGFQPAGCSGTCQPYKTTTCDTLDSCNILMAMCDQGSHMCVPRAAAGESCASKSCQYGLYCASLGAMKSTCQQPMMQMMTGGACDPIQDISTKVPSCAPGLYCQYNVGQTAATCQPKIAASLACDPTSVFSFSENACVDGYYCSSTAKVCTPFGGTNAACATDADCQTNFYCTPGKKCAAKIADGQPCTTGNSCLSTADLINTCIVANSDAGGYTTCQPLINVTGSCNPGFDNSICYPAGTLNSTTCTPVNNGGGVCASKCQ